MRRRAVRGGALAVVLAAPLAALSVPPHASGETVRLSDERRFTRSSHVARTVLVRERPSFRAPTGGRLRRLTEDGAAEVYLLLSQRVLSGGRTWVRLRLPGRPNGRTGWVPRDALQDFRLTRVALVVDRRRRRASLLRGGRTVWRAPIGIGAPGSPTPAGRYWIREQFRVRAGTIYGAYAFATSAYARISDWPGGGVVGIHGTDAPSLIPGRPSHGCVRLRNGDIRWLARRLPNGAPVEIR